jgi:YggT family protein
MHALIALLDRAIGLYMDVVIAAAILSWLTGFGVINRYNRVVAAIEDLLYRLTEPALRPIRRWLPNLGGIDISPVILILLLWFLQTLLVEDLAPLLAY